jgi:hypothetical protein
MKLRTDQIMRDEESLRTESLCAELVRIVDLRRRQLFVQGERRKPARLEGWIHLQKYHLQRISGAPILYYALTQRHTYICLSMSTGFYSVT